jgi:hypothetical protein
MSTGWSAREDKDAEPKKGPGWGNAIDPVSPAAPESILSSGPAVECPAYAAIAATDSQRPATRVCRLPAGLAAVCYLCRQLFPSF